MQFWPRVRARREHARIRHFAHLPQAQPLGFAGYKVGMTHVFVVDNNPRSMTKGETIALPVTVIECPPMRVAGIRFYASYPSLHAIADHFAAKQEKELYRTILKPKKEPKAIPGSFDDLTLLVHTMPGMTGIGKKKPELFEVGVGGKKEEKLAKAKELLGKDFLVSDVFKEGNLCDVHVITTGKGFQGPVKRFGISLRSHKSEKSRRAAVLGPWCGQGHVMYRVSHAGKMGYHMRVDYNKWILKFAKPEEVKVSGGYIHYGFPKNTCVLLKGSVPGPKKRIVKLTTPSRPAHRFPKDAPSITQISLHSPQGR
jgi:large subunit ribosomal protein L3